MKNLKKKSGENKNNLRTIYPRDQENSKKASLEFNFTSSSKNTVYRCEVQEMRLNYFFEIFFTLFS